MAGCAAVGCSNSSDKGKSMKRFPRDPKRRKLWAARTKRANWTPTDKSCLCEDHFDETQWEKIRQDGKKKLKCNAEPTLFSFSPPSKKRRILTDPKVKQAIPDRCLRSGHTSYNAKADPELQNVTDSAGDDLAPNQNDVDTLEKRAENPDSNETKIMCDVSPPLIKKSIPTYENTGVSQAIPESSPHSNSKAGAELQNVTDTCAVGDDLASNQNDVHTLVERTENQIKIKMLERFVQKQQAVIRSLKDNVKALTKKRKTAPNDILKKILNDNQISSLALESTRDFQWSEDTMEAALKLWSTYGTEAYEAVLSTGYPLPSLQTLRGKLEGMSGIQEGEFEILKSKVQNDSPDDS